MEQNFAFCEWEPYIGTASEQKAKNAKQRRNSMFLRCFRNITENGSSGVWVSGGHLCEAEAPTKPTGETADPYNKIITITYYKFVVVMTIFRSLKN